MAFTIPPLLFLDAPMSANPGQCQHIRIQEIIAKDTGRISLLLELPWFAIALSNLLTIEGFVHGKNGGVLL
jgi:hypothetical protein